MRNGQNKRMRGRNRKGGHHQNPLSRMYESNGPDVKIRGTASHVAEKYLQLARDAQSSGDPVAAENYYQHAEHYFRLIVAAQEHLRQTQPYYQHQQSNDGRGSMGDDAFDDGDGDGDQPMMGGEPFAPREQQPFFPREQQYQPQQQQPQQQQPHQQQPQHFQPRTQHFQPQAGNDEDVERLPSFITGGQGPQQAAPQQQAGNGSAANGPNGGGNQNGSSNGYEGSADRFPLHRRRRRHRGPRDQAMAGETEAPSGPSQGDE